MSKEIEKIAPRYIGDGVYASFDGWHIWLEVEREDGTHKIALEPEVFSELVRYFKDAWGKEFYDENCRP
jgi:hypothetical protein